MISRARIPGTAPLGGRVIPQQPAGIKPLAFEGTRPLLPGAKYPVPFGTRAPMAGRPLLSMKKGGKVKKTGAYKLHAGEIVIPADVESHAYDFRKRQGGCKKHG